MPLHRWLLSIVAGMKKPAEAIAAAYREEYGVRSFQFGGTVALLSQSTRPGAFSSLPMSMQSVGRKKVSSWKPCLSLPVSCDRGAERILRMSVVLRTSSGTTCG